MYFWHGVLAWSPGVFAVPASGMASQIDLAYDATKSQGYKDMRQMSSGGLPGAVMGGLYSHQRNNDVLLMPSFDKNMASRNSACNTCRFSDGAPKSLAFYAIISGQAAAASVPVVANMGQGGKTEVLAYPEGETHENPAYVLNLEARIQLAKLFERHQIESQLIGFVDTAAMTESRNTWVDGLNPNALTGAGIGFNFSYINRFEVKTYVAHKLANDAAVSARKPSNRIWIQVFHYF